MFRYRVGRYADRIREELRVSITEDHSPREIAASFGLGTFITMLPTLGTGLILFMAIVLVSDRVSKIALFASVVVFNPIVKWGVYVASFALGILLLGAVDGARLTEVSFDAGPEIVTRLVVGNLILAIVAAILGYVLVYRLAVAYRRTEIAAIVEEAVDEIVEEVVE